ncbi:MAG: chemotaxis protein CheV [SAR324 cluster bacterium]|nr:chemotaxis protein CheV [SAR324 cluster bacterium]
MATEILTESGTNEAEFLEFYLNRQSFAINVAKVVQITVFNDQDLTRTSAGNESVMGSLLWRDHTIDIIDLSLALNNKEAELSKTPVVLITNFNNMTCGFRVSGVNRIHRVCWDEIHPMDAILDRYSPRFIGTVTIENRNILLVDFEKLISELLQREEEADLHKELSHESKVKKRNSLKIIFAEDSALIRNNMLKYLELAGYQVSAHENGKPAWEHIDRLKHETAVGISMTEVVSLIITDIEMPQMDGLTFCRKIKEDERLSEIPVVIFSSLINEHMALKCKEVGANGYLSKPRTRELILKIDEMLLLESIS